jgi:hypothetical protein
LSLAETLEQLTKMDMLHSTIPFSQMLKGINDNINMPAERLDEYGADYKKRCDARGANFQRSKRLKWLIKRLLELGVNLELARIEELHDEIEAAEMEEMKAEKIRLETQTEKQRAAEYARKQEECTQRDDERVDR